MEPSSKVSTGQSTPIRKGPSDLTKLAMLNEHLNALDIFEAESLSKQVEKEPLVKIEEEKKSTYIPHADQAAAVFEANVMSLRVIRNAKKASK